VLKSANLSIDSFIRKTRSARIQLVTCRETMTRESRDIDTGTMVKSANEHRYMVVHKCKKRRFLPHSFFFPPEELLSGPDTSTSRAD